MASKLTPVSSGSALGLLFVGVERKDHVRKLSFEGAFLSLTSFKVATESL